MHTSNRSHTSLVNFGHDHDRFVFRSCKQINAYQSCTLLDLVLFIATPVSRDKDPLSEGVMSRGNVQIVTKEYIQQPKLTKPVSLTDFTCASKKNKRGNVPYLKLYESAIRSGERYNSFRYIPPVLFVHPS